MNNKNQKGNNSANDERNIEIIVEETLELLNQVDFFEEHHFDAVNLFGVTFSEQDRKSKLYQLFNFLEIKNDGILDTFDIAFLLSEIVSDFDNNEKIMNLKSVLDKKIRLYIDIVKFEILAYSLEPIQEINSLEKFNTKKENFLGIISNQDTNKEHIFYLFLYLNFLKINLKITKNMGSSIFENILRIYFYAIMKLSQIRLWVKSKGKVNNQNEIKDKIKANYDVILKKYSEPKFRGNFIKY